jgi:hypothetical protein
MEDMQGQLNGYAPSVASRSSGSGQSTRSSSGRDSGANIITATVIRQTPIHSESEASESCSGRSREQTGEQVREARISNDGHSTNNAPVDGDEKTGSSSGGA